MVSICVFCSSNEVDGKYKDSAREMGKLIGKNSWDLIYGGTDRGLMGVLALSVRENGGKVVGVVPRIFDYLPGPEHKRLMVDDLKERKAIMIEKSDAFIGIAGGFGTLDEILEIIALKIVYQDKMNKPMIILNQEGFYDPMISQFERIYKEGFASRKDLYDVAESPEEVVKILKRSNF